MPSLKKLGTLALQREHERRTAIQRLSGQRDLVWIQRDALDDPSYREDADALLANIDAVLEALAVAMVPEPRLNTLQRRIDLFLHAPQAALARLAPALARRLEPYRRGRSSKLVEWQPIARRLYRQTRGPRRAAQTWDRLVERAEGDDEIIHEAVATEERSSCQDIRGGRCSHGPHLHWWHRGKDQLLTVSRKRILNFFSTPKKK